MSIAPKPRSASANPAGIISLFLTLNCKNFFIAFSESEVDRAHMLRLIRTFMFLLPLRDDRDELRFYSRPGS